jgi:hypothetical protein
MTGEVFVEVGAHRVEARHELYGVEAIGVTATKGMTVPVRLGLGEVAPVVVVPVPPKRSVVPGAVLGGVAGAALVTGLGLFAAGRVKRGAAHSAYDALFLARQGCVPGIMPVDARCNDLLATASEANTFQQVGVGLMIGAGAAALGSVIYFVAPRSTSAVALRVTPVLSPSAVALIFTGEL